MSSSLISKDFVYAVVGASNNKDKFGYKISRDLIEIGLKIIPINLKEKSILNLKTYTRLSDYPGKIDVVVFIVPPEVTKKVLREVNELEIKKVWMQPGSESKKAIAYCREKRIQSVRNSCIRLTAKKQ